MKKIMALILVGSLFSINTFAASVCIVKEYDRAISVACDGELKVRRNHTDSIGSIDTSAHLQNLVEAGYKIISTAGLNAVVTYVLSK